MDFCYELAFQGLWKLDTTQQIMKKKQQYCISTNMKKKCEKKNETKESKQLNNKHEREMIFRQLNR